MTRAARTHRSPPPYRSTKNRFAFVSKSGVLPMKAVRVSQPVLRKMSEIVFRDDLYPRIKTSAETVQKYAEDLSVLPAIEVNQHNELIDGWHRWTAHKKVKAESIQVIVTETKSEAEFLELAIERNATHGLQLSQRDKEKMAGRLYAAFLRANPSKKECTEYKERLANKVLKCGLRSIERWTARDDRDHEKDLEEIAFAAWLANSTQEEIAELTGWS